MGGFYFFIARMYPVATITKTIAKDVSIQSLLSEGKFDRLPLSLMPIILYRTLSYSTRQKFAVIAPLVLMLAKRGIIDRLSCWI
jgi:hypothetical protein